MFPSTLLGAIGMLHPNCPVCGLPFLRETGYFLGAMYVSYGLGVLTILPTGLFLSLVLEWPLIVVIPIVMIQAILLMPLFLRYSRIIWLHLDQMLDPR